MAHNPEVAGSNPAPATKFAGQRPLPITEGAFCVCRVHGIVHEASEEGRRGTGGETYPDVVRREAQAYGQQRAAELGIDPSDVPARVQEFLKADS